MEWHTVRCVLVVRGRGTVSVSVTVTFVLLRKTVNALVGARSGKHLYIIHHICPRPSHIVTYTHLRNRNMTIVSAKSRLLARRAAKSMGPPGIANLRAEEALWTGGQWRCR